MLSFKCHISIDDCIGKPCISGQKLAKMELMLDLPLVEDETGAAGQFLVADGALVVLGSVVWVDVRQQRRLEAKRLVAHVALKHTYTRTTSTHQLTWTKRFTLEVFLRKSIFNHFHDFSNNQSITSPDFEIHIILILFGSFSTFWDVFSLNSRSLTLKGLMLLWIRKCRTRSSGFLNCLPQWGHSSQRTESMILNFTVYCLYRSALEKNLKILEQWTPLNANKSRPREIVLIIQLPTLPSTRIEVEILYWCMYQAHVKLW